MAHQHLPVLAVRHVAVAIVDHAYFDARHRSAEKARVPTDAARSCPPVHAPSLSCPNLDQRKAKAPFERQV